MESNYFKTGVEKIDNLLDGGLKAGEVCHFFGESGSGKSTICLQASIEVIKEGFSCFFIAANRFPSERFRQLLERPSDLSKNLFVFESNNYSQQKDAIFGLNEIEEHTKPIGLVVVDGLTSFYNPSSAPEEERFFLKKELAHQLIYLIGLSRKRSFSILVTNQVYEDIDSGEKRPRGGKLVSDISFKNIELKETKGKRGLAILRDPNLDSKESRAYKITDKGLV